MPDTSVDTPKQRTARACENCRRSKSRCIYKTELGVCQRCEAIGNECIIRSKARPMRTRAVQPTSRINKSSQSPTFGDSEKFSLNLPKVAPSDARKDLEDLHLYHRTFFDVDHPEELSQNGDQPCPSVLEPRQVTLAQAEELLNAFRQKATTFPFVHIPPEATVSCLSRTSPFLLLAILTTASIRDRPLYLQMDHEFRRVLSLKVILEGQKSLYFLQGLYPIHVSPKKNQSFMYMSLAISLIVDLGLDRESPKQTGFNAISKAGLVDGEHFSKAAKRAYLGCYYMSAALSLAFQKLNIQYRNLIDAHGELLLQNEESIELYSMVKLQNISEKITDFYASKQTISIEADLLDEDVHIQEFLNEIQDWRRSTSDDFRNLPIIGLADRVATVHLYGHKLGFLKSPYREVLSSSVNNLERINPAHLWGCLEACKKFHEYVLSLPEAIYANFTTVQWTCIVKSILVLSRLTFVMAGRLGWDSSLGTTKYLDAAYAMKMMLGSVKKSYERRVAAIEPGYFVGDVASAIIGHCLIMHPSLRGYFDGATLNYEEPFSLGDTTSSNASSVMAPLYHDLWATMTGSWASKV